MKALSAATLYKLAQDIRGWAHDLGFDSIGISATDLSEAALALREWLQQGWHGEMDFMERHVQERTRPELLVPETIRVISVRLGYWRA